MMLHVDPFGGYHYILDGSTHQTVEMIPMIEMFIWTKFQEPDARSISWTRMFTMEPRPFVPSMAVSAPCQTMMPTYMYKILPKAKLVVCRKALTTMIHQLSETSQQTAVKILLKAKAMSNSLQKTTPWMTLGTVP